MLYFSRTKATRDLLLFGCGKGHFLLTILESGYLRLRMLGEQFQIRYSSVKTAMGVFFSFNLLENILKFSFLSSVCLSVCSSCSLSLYETQIAPLSLLSLYLSLSLQDYIKVHNVRCSLSLSLSPSLLPPPSLSACFFLLSLPA